MDEITIAGYVFPAPSPYAEGHVCNRAEADALNRKLHANLRANFAKEIEQRKDRVVDYDHAKFMSDLQADFAAYASTYRLGSPDPADAEAHTIALGIVRRAIKGSGKNLSDYSKAQLNQQADDLLLGPLGGEIKRLARERVTALQAAAKAELARVQGEQQ